MSHRLSNIYTRTGDQGTTGLGDGSRVYKDSARVEAYGTVDELNSIIGLLLSEEVLPGNIHQVLTDIQHELFDLGGELSTPGHVAISDSHVNRLETVLDELNEKLPPLKEFILPAGSRAAAICHLARAVCRRAERRIISLHKAGNISPVSIKYLNRLSDLLFVTARVLNKHAGYSDVLWRAGRS